MSVLFKNFWLGNCLGFRGGSVVENPPARARCRCDPWSWKIRLEKEMAVHSPILARKTPWTEEPGRL